MRLLSLAVVAGLFATGFAFADEPKKADKPADTKKDGMKFTGMVTKVDGMKIMVKGEGKDGKEMTFTATEKTKYMAAKMDKEEKKDGDKPKDKEIAFKADKDKDAKEMTIKDVKEGSKVSVMYDDKMMATEVWIYPATDKKPIEK